MVKLKRLSIVICVIKNYIPNSLWPSLCGGHNDDKAVEKWLREETWGWLIEKGATIIQTGRPKELLKSKRVIYVFLVTHSTCRLKLIDPCSYYCKHRQMSKSRLNLTLLEDLLLQKLNVIR